MLRHCVVNIPLKRCCTGRSYVTLACSATCRPLIQRSCLLAAGRAHLSPLSQFLPWRLASYRLLFEKHCFPTLSRVELSPVTQPVSWHCMSGRQKNTYYGFSRGKPKPLSTYGKFYHIFLMVGLSSFILTPLYVPVLIIVIHLIIFDHFYQIHLDLMIYTTIHTC